MDQPKLERDVVFGADAGVVAGMEIGDCCVIGAWLGGYVVDPLGFNRGRKPGARPWP